MNQIEVHILNAFVDNDQGGNPAGVVLNADHLSKQDKLTIAQKVGLSETAFISKSSIADFKLDFFSPTKQIAHCGHATIASFSYLKQINLLKSDNTSKETIDGPRKINIQGDLAFMEQNKPKYTDLINKKNDILLSLGLTDSDLIDDTSINLVNTGNSFIIVPIRNSSKLKEVEPNQKLIEEICSQLDAVGYYLFSLETLKTGRDASTRMFAPGYGIPEEAATGMAAGTLACYLHDIVGKKKNQFLIEQGAYMSTPSPSLIIVDLNLENGEIASLMAGGKGLLNQTISIEL